MDKDKRDFLKKSILGVGAGLGLSLFSYLKPVNALQNINFSDGSTQAVAYQGNKNIIINGNFDIWQRGTSFSNISSTTSVADRYKVALSGVGRITVDRSTDTPNGNTNYSIRLTASTNDSSIASDDVYLFYQAVEGLNWKKTGFGTSDAKDVTVSFWVKSSITGTYCISLRGGNIDRSYVQEYTINSVDTWEKKVVTFPADTGGTWPSDNTRAALVSFDLGTGTDFQGTAGSWQASNIWATSNQTSWIGTTSATFFMSQLQVEIGDKATDFEFREFGDELRRCQRYYEKSYDYSTVPGTTTYNGNILFHTAYNVSSVYYHSHHFKVEKRAAPTVTIYSPGTGATSTIDRIGGSFLNSTAQQITTSSFTLLTNTSIGQNYIIYYHFTADAEL